MPAPAHPPVGLHLARVARAVGRAFDAALAEAGGSLPSWLIMISLKTGSPGNQSDLAAAVGIRGATLTHHLNTLEDNGLVTRRRDPQNRRVQHVMLTAEGEAAFHRMRHAAVAFDQRLRRGLSDRQIAAFTRVLDQLQKNASPD